MDNKETYIKWVQIAKSELKRIGKPYRNEDIADLLRYSRPYFSTLTGKSGKVTKKHLEDFSLRFPFVKDNQTFMKDSPSVGDPENNKTDFQDKYIALLERDRDLLENKIDRIEVNLDLVRNGQMGVLMAIQVGLDEQAELKAAVLKTDPAVVKEAVNRKLKKGLKVGNEAG